MFSSIQFLCFVLLSVLEFSVSHVCDPALGIRTDKTITKEVEMERFINDTMHENPIVIFSKSYCQVSNNVKQIFDKLEKRYHVIDIDKRAEAGIIQDILLKLSGNKTIPRVFVVGRCLGGAREVIDLYESGTLAQLLEDLQ